MDKYIGASVQIIVGGEFVQVAVQAQDEATLAEAVERIEGVSDVNNTGSK